MNARQDATTGASRGRFRGRGRPVAVWLGLALCLAHGPRPARADGAVEALAPALAAVEREGAQARRDLAECHDRIAAAKQTLVDAIRSLEAEQRDALAAARQAQAATAEVTAQTRHLEEMAGQHVQVARHIANLCLEYRRNLETRLRAAEAGAAGETFARIDAELDAETRSVSPDILAALLELGAQRCTEAVGGSRFAGTAAATDGRLVSGTYLAFGPVAFFRADAGEPMGLAVQEVGSIQPTIYADFETAERAALERLFTAGKAAVPVDLTMGSGVRLRQSRETLVEHLRKGGVTMVPLLLLGAGCALIVLYKLGVVFSLPTARCQRRVLAIVDALLADDVGRASDLAAALRPPLRAVVSEGIAHRNASKEHLEEILYEQILAQVPALERFLSPLAVCASAAPLLGLLGTVTGMIHTFRLITVFGTGDARLLSSGISEALVTTEVGLVIAIPALLFHAYLSRRVRRTVGMVQEMALALVNGIHLRNREAP